MDMSQYLEIFIEESKEHLQHMNSILLELENSPENFDLLNEIFRIAHTIKGMSGTMGFNKLANLTHEMENVLHLVRNKEIEVSEGIIDILFECFDGLEEYINTLIETGAEGDRDTTDLVNRLKMIVEKKAFVSAADIDTAVEVVESEEVVISEKASDDFSIEMDESVFDIVTKAGQEGLIPLKIKVVISKDSMLKAARAYIVFNTLEEYGEILKSFPITEEIEDEKFDDSFEVIFVSKLDATTTKNEIEKISEIEMAIVEEIHVDATVVETVVEEVEVLNTDLEETPVIPQTPKVEATKAPAPKPTTKKKADEGKQTKAKTTAKTVRVDIERLDTLMNLVSELIIIKTRLEDTDQSGVQNSHDAIEYLERITTSLHDAVMKVRMVPVERVFNRFPRMVRDLSKELGKGIKLFMSGEETEVDRTVIDEIADPLIHLIRNSIDHGIESPEVRSSKGKDETGSVFLRAYPDGNTVCIEVEDNGNGIDETVIANKALEKGIVTDSEVEMMNQKELINLLFRPGFSTAEQITDLSGRGVGLDVVKTKIESLNGTVEVDSVKGEGSKFTIRLPLTLAIIQALMVNLGNEKYALPLNNIKEITTIETSSISLVQNQEVVLYRNKTLPIIRLNHVLDVTYDEEQVDKNEMIVVVVRKGEQEAGIVVDSLIGQQEIVIKSLGKYLTGIKVIAGATILGNGSVALIIDPNQLF
jgi:two-component system chemotaxis sensor kinase CheA